MGQYFPVRQTPPIPNRRQVMQKTKVESLAMAVAKMLAEKKRTGKDSARRAEAVREAFQVALNERVKKLLSEKREALRNSSQLWETLEANEGFLNGIKAIVSAAAGAGGNAVASGLGISGNKVGKIVKAFKKKKGKQYDVSKAPTRRKLAKRPMTKPSTTEPIKMSRTDFARHLKQSGNQLNKMKV
jgi:hypothetical protein